MNDYISFSLISSSPFFLQMMIRRRSGERFFVGNSIRFFLSVFLSLLTISAFSLMKHFFSFFETLTKKSRISDDEEDEMVDNERKKNGCEVGLY